MRKWISFILMLLFVLTLMGCGANNQVTPDAPNAMVPSIMYEGRIFRTTGKAIPAEVDESAIVGEISSVVPLSQLPCKEGEACVIPSLFPYTEMVLAGTGACQW